MYIGAIEVGVTRIVCAVGTKHGKIVDKISFPTVEPDRTIKEIVSYFEKFQRLKSENELSSIGIGTFGPIDLDKKSDTYGYILNTSKIQWKNFDVLGNIKEKLKLDIAIDTDVNTYCLGEATFGCAKGMGNIVYITIGTGIGAGVYCNNKLVHGTLHPEAGHIIVKRHEKDNYEGKCPYHKDCLEGMASGPAIEDRWGKNVMLLYDNDEVWELEAYYIAQALVNYIYMLSPQKIILGGGVMHQEKLFPMIRRYVKEMLNGYMNIKEIEDIDNYIVHSSLNDNQGILGAIQLGARLS